MYEFKQIRDLRPRYVEVERAMRALARDSLLRHRIGQAGRDKVEREYSLQVTAPILAGWLTEAACGGRG